MTETAYREREQTVRGRRLLAWLVIGGAGVLPFGIVAAANSWWAPGPDDFVRMEIARTAAAWTITASAVLSALVLRRWSPVSRSTLISVLTFLVGWTYIGWVSVLSAPGAGVDGVPYINRSAAILFGGLLVLFPALLIAALVRRL